MKLSRVFLSFYIAFVTLPLNAQGSIVYVSSSEGFGYYDGHDEAHPMNNLQNAIKKGDMIFLKAGDVFYERGLVLNGKTLSRYGDGPNPIVCGYKRIVEPRWVKVENNIWRLNLVDGIFEGIVIKGSSFSNNVCSFHDYKNDLIHGHKVQFKDDMTFNWDFWQTESLRGAKPEEYDYLYLFLTEDPNYMKLEMSIYDQALRVSNSIVDGVNFEGYGFGISAKSNTTIRNCRIDAMGGRIIPEGNSYTCYGNGIEFWVGDTTNVENCIVEDCFVTRCYDCGVTIQGSGGTTATPRNISIRNNLITNCCQGWEDFLRNGEDVIYENCVFENNVVLKSGNTSGFGYSSSRFKYCHVLGNNVAGDKGMCIYNNIFADGNYYCSGTYKGGYRSNKWKGNKCFITKGDFLLGEYFGRRDVLRIGNSSFKSKNVIRRYRYLTGDNTTIFKVISRKKMASKTNSLERSFLKTHKY